MLTLYYHPFSSFCQKVLVALYELDIPFERRIIDLGDPSDRAELAALWPLTKFPVLRDDQSGVTLPESSIIIEYLARSHPGSLLPADFDEALQVRLWDRVLDTQIEVPLQKVVGDTFRPEGRHDPEGVEQAKAALRSAYQILDVQLAHGGWIAGGDFSMADCGAGPALFYANVVEPFSDHTHLAAYYRRLLERPSFARTVDEARPYRDLFPLAWPADYD